MFDFCPTLAPPESKIFFVFTNLKIIWILKHKTMNTFYFVILFLSNEYHQMHLTDLDGTIFVPHIFRIEKKNYFNLSIINLYLNLIFN